MKSIAFVIVFFAATCAMAQKESTAEVIHQLEDLTKKWDEDAYTLQTFKGYGSFCSDSFFRKKVVDMLNSVHHYDTLLTQIVKEKELDNKEAEATLKDISKLEKEYTTAAFRDFMHKECTSFNDIENNQNSFNKKEYHKAVHKLEKELKKYVSEITKQIDLINKHAHHLDLD